MINNISVQEVRHFLQAPKFASLDLQIPPEYISNVPSQNTVEVSTGYLDLAASNHKEGRIADISEDYVDRFQSHGRMIDSPISFKYFPKLPLEIRRQIWGLATTDILPRCIRVVEKPRFDGSSDLVVYGAPRPPLLTTCKEVYDEVLSTKTYRSMFRMVHSPKSVYFNPELDIVELAVDQTKIGFPLLRRVWPQLIFSQHLSNPNDATEALQNFRISLAGGDPSRSFEKWMVNNIDTLGSLKTFALGGIIPFTRPTSHPWRPIRFFFEQMSDGVFNHGYPMPGPDVSPFFVDDCGEYFHGNDAMQRIKHKLHDSHQGQRFVYIWIMLGRVVKQTKKLPKVFEAQFDYVLGH